MLDNATKYMYFNIDRNVFTTKDFREDIKKLFKDFWDWDISSIDIKTLDDFSKLSNILQEIKQNEMLFQRIFNYPLKRSGNAEVLLFLLINNSYLSNSSCSGVDLIVGEDKYEIKNCFVSNKYKSGIYYHNFKLGNSFCIREIINNLEKYFNFIPKGSQLNEARNCEEFLKLEETYRDIVYENYFKNTNVILIDKSGIIHFVGKVKKEDIFIDTITEGTIKPMIKA